ncbi:MAG: hypothetical protein D6795_07120, partial [Deltaproteobacteria bacterium]
MLPRGIVAQEALGALLDDHREIVGEGGSGDLGGGGLPAELLHPDPLEVRRADPEFLDDLDLLVDQCAVQRSRPPGLDANHGVALPGVFLDPLKIPRHLRDKVVEILHLADIHDDLLPPHDVEGDEGERGHSAIGHLDETAPLLTGLSDMPSLEVSGIDDPRILVEHGPLVD